jgi:hypothetical protein
MDRQDSVFGDNSSAALRGYGHLTMPRRHVLTMGEVSRNDLDTASAKKRDEAAQFAEALSNKCRT